MKRITREYKNQSQKIRSIFRIPPPLAEGRHHERVGVGRFGPTYGILLHVVLLLLRQETSNHWARIGANRLQKGTAYDRAITRKQQRQRSQ